MVRAASALVLAALANSVSMSAEQTDTPVYLVTYLEVLPTAAATTAALTRGFAAASRKESGNIEFRVFEEASRPSQFVMLETWRDPSAAQTHQSAAGTVEFRERLRPYMISGLSARPHSSFYVAGASSPSDHGQPIVVVTHLDVFPAGKDQAAEWVKTEAEAARKDRGNLRYDVVRLDDHLNHFTLIEFWRDRASFDASATSAHTREFRGKITPLEGAPYDERLYTLVP
jgi:quinol monooxygenase YgiN